MPDRTPATTALQQRHFVGVDVGVVHLALAMCHTNAAYEDFTVQRVQLIDITELEHQRVPRSRCPLSHTGMACDRVLHVIQERQALFDAAEEVVVERQPPQGIRDVEQVFVTVFRTKCHVMAPQTMHKFLHSSGYEYAERKQISIRTAKAYVPDITAMFEKADDVADAVCLVLTRVSQLHDQHSRQARRAAALDRGLDFEAFRYKGPVLQRYPDGK